MKNQDCSYELRIGDRTLTFKDDHALNVGLLSLLKDNVLDTKDLKIRVASIDPQERALAIIAEMQETLDKSKIAFEIFRTAGDPFSAEKVYKYPRSIGANRVISTFGNYKDIEKPMVTPLNLDDFKLKRREKYRTEHPELSERDITIKIDNEISTWKVYSEIGQEIHAMFEHALKGEDYTPTWPTGFPKIKAERIERDVKNFINFLKTEHPEGKIFTEIDILSKQLSDAVKNKFSQYDSINGRVDLMVVENGKVYIYDFKISRKDLKNWDTGDNTLADPMDWPTTKKLSVKDQMAIYSAILQQYGLTVADTRIVPIRLEVTIDEDSKLIKTDEHGDMAIDSLAVQTTLDSARNAYFPYTSVPIEKQFTQITSNILPVNNEFKMEGLESTFDTYSKLFTQVKSIQKQVVNRKIEIEDLKRDKNFVKSVDKTHAKYQDGYRKYFYRSGLNETQSIRYAKDDAELDLLLQEYVNDLNRKKHGELTKFGKKIGQTLASGADYTTIAEDFSSESSRYISAHFKPYIKNGWTFIENEELNAAGFFIFKKNGVFDIVMLTNSALLTNKEFTFGHSILGDYISDRSWDKKHILAASNGNLEAFKALTYIMNNQSAFSNGQIRNIKVMNPWMRQSMTPSMDTLLDNWDRLLRYKDDVVNTLDKSLFKNSVNVALENCLENLALIEEKVVDFKIKYNADDVDVNAEYLLYKLEELRKKLKLQEGLRNDKKRNMESPEWQAYVQLLRAYFILKMGVDLQYEPDQGFYWNGGMIGLYTSSVQFSPSVNHRIFGDVQNDYTRRIRELVSKYSIPLNVVLNKFYDANGRVRVLGGEANLFSEWIQKDANGQISPEFKFVDPDSPAFKGNAQSKAALKHVLKILNEIRFNGNPDKIEEAYAYGTYFQIPLLKARDLRRGKNIGWKRTLEQMYHDAQNLVDGVFTEELGRKRDFELEQNRLYNRFDLAEETRNKWIEEEGVGFFETDIERVMHEVILSYTKQQVSDEFLPIFQAIDLSLQLQQDFENIDVENIRKAYQQSLTKKIYGDPIMLKELQGIYKCGAVLKTAFSKLALGLNSKSYVREMLQGTWMGLSRSGIKMMEGLTLDTYVKAGLHVLWDSRQNYKAISLLQQLNLIYGMANMSVNEIPDKMRSNSLGIRNWNENTLFLNTTAPDFQHRVTILVAKMMSDGCFDAHSIDENGMLKYDVTKDKRFEQFLKGNTSHKDYYYQRALYEANINEWNAKGYNLRMDDGTGKPDALPHAYTTIEASSIKNFSEILYGHYDSESRALINDLFLGSFFMQFKTYIVAKMEQWMMKPGVYNMGKFKQQFDPKTGEELWQVITYPNEDGTGAPITKIKRKSEVTQEEWDSKAVQPYVTWEGEPMEGIVYSLFAFAKSFRHIISNPEEFKRVWNDPIARRNLYVFIHDMLWLSLLSFLIKMLYEALFGDDVVRKLKDQSAAVQWSYSVLQGSTQDGSIFRIMKDMFWNKPPIMSAWEKLQASSLDVIIGDDTIVDFFTTNVGAVREFNNLLE